MLTLPFTIYFGELGDYKLWAGSGWHHDENETEYTWTSEFASLIFSLERVAGSLIVTVDMISAFDAQDVFIYINGGFVAFWPLREAALKVAGFDAVLLRLGENKIAIVCPRAICPKMTGSGTDERMLGVAIRTLSIDRKTG